MYNKDDQKKGFEINKIVTQLVEAKEAYYNDEPIMSDEEFDSLEDKLRGLCSDHPYFQKVGIQSRGKKIKHQVSMLSCQKAKNLDELFVWINKLNLDRPEFIIEPKIDGLSATIKYENGKLKYIATRGGGIEGQDVTWLKDYLTIPHTLEETEDIEIRGELVILKNSQIENLNNKPLRNLASGLVNRKEERDKCKHLTFIGYNIIGILSSFDYEHQKILKLMELGFLTVGFFKVSEKEHFKNYYDRYLNELRNTWLFETDGLVVIVNRLTDQEEVEKRWVVDHHHHYNCALKPPAESKKNTPFRYRMEFE